MKLIIVKRTRRDTYKRLLEKFADDLDVRVMLDGRLGERRLRGRNNGPERRSGERRKLLKDFGARDYVVIHVADPRRMRQM